MKAAAVLERPDLTVIRGGRVDITLPLADVEEVYVELLAVTTELGLALGHVHAGARRVQVAIAAERPAVAGQVAHDIEEATAAAMNRARSAHKHAAAALDELRRPGPRAA